MKPPNWRSSQNLKVPSQLSEDLTKLIEIMEVKHDEIKMIDGIDLEGCNGYLLFVSSRLTS
jgi:hypothetical protein